MVEAHLDNGIRRKLDQLAFVDRNDEEQSQRYRSLMTFVGFVEYGTDAVLHARIMKMAHDEVVRGDFPIDQFCAKYQFGLFHGNISEIPVRVLEQNGVYVTAQAYYPHIPAESKTILFSPDYRNKFFDWGGPVLERPKYKYAFQLMNRVEAHEDLTVDLEDSKFLREGLRFGEDVWKLCVESFEHYAPKEINLSQPALSVEVIELTQKLIEYYSAVIAESKIER